jgi:glutamate/tyrosine decarboxylase-like PLP-dependent enzyme
VRTRGLLANARCHLPAPQSRLEVFIEAGDQSPLIKPYPEARPLQDPEFDAQTLLYRTAETFATGHGCSADWRPVRERQRASSVIAECFPVVEVPTVTPDLKRLDGTPVEVDMAALADLAVGGSGFDQMSEVVDLYRGWIARKEVEVESLESRYAAAAKDNLAACTRAADRMQEGLAYLDSSPSALLAFKLANRAVLLQQISSNLPLRRASWDTNTGEIAFERDFDDPATQTPPPGRGKWRAFQIAFLLSAIASAGEYDHPERRTVELIWFPTGGGKTEAYLGLVAFTCFKRRLDDPQDVGVQALMRYTLRLLTAQQFLRASSLISAMELLRLQRLDLPLGVEPFSIGIWVGGDTTPNRHEDARVALRKMQQSRRAANKFLLNRCPWCAAEFKHIEQRRRGTQGEGMMLGYKREDLTVVAHCPDRSCPFHNQLPVYVVDEAIYERRPSLVIGTIDKFAILAWRPEARFLFGLGANGERESSPPGLILQDELHLITGPLGSLAGLFETVVEELCTDRRRRKTRDNGIMQGAMKDDTRETLEFVYGEAQRYLAALPEELVKLPHGDAAARSLPTDFPEEGLGALAALKTLTEDGVDAATRSSGPRFFHFVTGGCTPAALAADWLTAVLDQNAFSWVSSPLGTRLEAITIDWLIELFRLPSSWGGILTTGTTTAHITCLAAARGWWAERHGIDVDQEGFAGLPAVPVFTSGYVHTTALKALAVLGVGHQSVRILSRDPGGRLDVDVLRDQLRALNGAPAILIATAGEVNAGHFDPLASMADLAHEFDAWLHVDASFGLFAALSPRTADLLDGVERAHSVVSDGHKWLNVPYDCGFAFLGGADRLARTFTISADYISGLVDAHPDFGHLGPESSRRARSLAVWATLRAYGRSGYREMVERHLDLAQRIAEQVDQAPELERLADVPLNVVCFRYRPPGVPESALDRLNQRLGAAILEDGRVYVGSTRYSGKVAFRPAVANWRTGPRDVDLLIEVVRELGERVTASVS